MLGKLKLQMVSLYLGAYNSSSTTVFTYLSLAS